ncbi:MULTISPECIES: hypothetical protein [Kitasatospora]|uniref:Uncharacterized protein n=1 Tax=Kitasatospora setae (strain ATCC 33774 / DSM 43861 / JCM 3304 / KCC A-0304 / NBRC 14216 / KM-6054) TaxID=452652 RepID=E4N4L5_KITSK|nr:MULTISPECIES: hypothetical protein [Kitasatospora]BAJ26146.1 hypothetical protein KSE_02990 [Kitasatospora setae KM-6054]
MLVWADDGCANSLVEYGLTVLALALVTVKRGDDTRGFALAIVPE